MVLLGRKTIHSTKEEEKEKMRDTKTIEMYSKKLEKKLKELEIFKLLKKEVNHGANGTQDYVIKKGINKGKVAK
jgi:hypothetical protein